MNLPAIISALLHAQASFDSNAYANCFSETAVVFDEGKTYRGRNEIKQWNEKTNMKYNTVLEPIEFTAHNLTGILTTRVSGTFEGSPLVLKYYMELKDGEIEMLKITG